MKFGVPWGAKKGIRPDARETAMEAARRSGMSLDDWLNSVIMHQAAQAGVQPYAPAPAKKGKRKGQQEAPQAGQQPDPRALAAVNNRLDDLSRRIEQFTGAAAQAQAPQARAPQRPVRSQGPDQRAELIGRLDRYVHNAQPQAQAPMPQRQQPRQMPPQRSQPAAPPAMNQALADIAARKQMLSGGGAPPPPPPRRASSPADYAPPATRAQQQAQAAAQAAKHHAAMPAPLPTQDLSGLEEQLRKITDQIETLRQPGVEQAINALRAELGEIGHALGEAVPRHSIETIEHQIHGLTQRIAEGRENGVDHNALGGIEHGLMEVRDALHGLTPAENLIGFNDAVAGLAQKIDLIVAQKDPESMAQLENAITTLRSMANHVASNDAVGALSAEVQALADKVDYIARASANTDALSSLEARIDALGQALAERAQAGNAVPPRLEALVQSLADKIEQIQAAQQAHGDVMTEGHVLDDRIAMLVDRLDASDSRLGQLEAVERGLADLLMHIEQQQQSTNATAGQDGEAMAVDALKHDFAQAQEALKFDLAQAQEALKSDLTNSLTHSLVHSQDEIKGDIARTQNALDQVHGTLGELVGRLAAIEQSIRSETHAAAAAPAPAYADVAHEGHYAHEDPYAHEGTPYAHDEEPLELNHPVGKVAVRLVEDAAPGMSAFDGMLPPRSAQPEPTALAEPEQPMPVEPELFAPPIQPEHAPMFAAPEPVAATDTERMDHADYVDHIDHVGHSDYMEATEQAVAPHAPLPPAPQLEAQLEALRAQAAPTFAPRAEAPSFEAPYVEAPQAEAPPTQPQKRMAPGHGPINPDLPPDEPLEPGSGPPPLRAHPGARIGASEAASNHAGESADEASGGKLSFIAAARRAAQAAMQQEPAPPSLEADYEEEAPETATHPLRKRMMRRVKSLFVAASIVAIVVGSVQIAATYLKLGKPGAPATRTTQQHLGKTSERANAGPETANANRVRQAGDSTAAVTAPSRIAATPLALVPPSTSIDLLAPPDQTVRVATMPAPDPRRASVAASNDATSPDITGSIPQATANRSTRAPAVGTSNLPIAIGGPRLRQAATAGNAAAAYEVATRFAEGRGVPANLAKAARWYERAANKGLAPAEFRLASLFEKGQGVKKNLARARALYFAAARQGHAKAMHNLAVLYAEGIEGKPDYTTAVQWFRDAAAHGVSDSQYNLGVLYARGIGVEKDLAESYKWFALAAKHGDKQAARKRDEVASHLDKKALAAARQAVAKFVPKPQPRQATTVPAPPGGWDKTAAAPAARTTADSAQAFVAGKQ